MTTNRTEQIIMKQMRFQVTLKYKILQNIDHVDFITKYCRYEINEI